MNKQPTNENARHCVLCGAQAKGWICENCDPNELYKIQDKSLNKIFYDGFPKHLFSTSLFISIACLGQSSKMLDLLENKTTYEKLTANFEEEDREENKQQIELWAKAEIATAYFHAIETLLRLFFAHMDLPPCPWLEIAELRNFREFKELVKKLHSGELENIDKKIALSFFGYSDYPKSNGFPLTMSEWEMNIKSVKEFLIFFAGDLLGNEDYNAFKHGLAVFLGNRGISLRNKENNEVIFGREGDSTMSLFLDEKGYWTQKINFFDIDKRGAFIFMAEKLIKQLINIAKARYLELKSAEYQRFDKITLDKIIKNSQSDEAFIEVTTLINPLWPPIGKKVRKK